VLRLVATVTSLAVTAQGFVPLALACCTQPSAHSCCIKAQQAEDPAARQLGKAPCCRAESRAQQVNKEEAIGGQIRTPSAAPAIIVVQPVPLPVLSVALAPSNTSPPGSVRGLGPPLPLRI